VEKTALVSIDVSILKTRFAGKFPDHPLTPILLSEPDKLSFSDFLAKAQTWLAFFQGEKKNE
jgi:hypothetical protein